MEKGYTDNRLKKRRIIEEHQIFFVQRLMELLHPLTLDTYSIRATNSHSILTELLEVITLVSSGVATHQNLIPLRDECLATISNDIVLDMNAKQLKNTLLSYIDKTKKDDLPVTKYHLAWALNAIKGKYLTWCLSSLEKVLIDKKLDDIESVSSILITELVQMGWTTEELRSLVRRLIDNSYKKSFESALKDLLLSLSQQQKPFTCLAKIPNAESIKLYQLFQLAKYEVLDAESVIKKFDMPLLKDKISPNNYYAVIYNVLAYGGDGAAQCRLSH